MTRVFVPPAFASVFSSRLAAVLLLSSASAPIFAQMPAPNASPALPANTPVPPEIENPKPKVQNQTGSPFIIPTPNGPITVRRVRDLVWRPDGTVHAEGGAEIEFSNSGQAAPLTLRADTLDYDPNTQALSAQGGVRATYADPGANRLTTLTAESFAYDAEIGTLTAQGKVRLERSEGVFTGDSITYNFEDRSGTIINGNLVSDYLRLLGKRIESIYDPKTKTTRYVEHAVFTTCIENRPDYQLHARRLTYVPGRYVSTRDVTLYAGRVGFITLPSYRQNLQRGNGGSNPLPTPGYNQGEGVTLRFRNTPLAEPHRIVDYDARLSFKNFPVGFASYQQDVGGLVPLRPNDSSPRGALDTLNDPLRGYLETLTAPTFQEYVLNRFAVNYEKRATAFVVVQRQSYTYNRRRTDLNVSRFPEFGLRLNNVLARSAAPVPTNDANAPGIPPGSDGENDPTRTGISPVLQRIPNAPFLVNLTASLGAIDEQPTRVTSARLGGRAEFATQPLMLARRLSLRAGATDLVSLYSRGGSLYNLFMPEVALNYAPTSTSVFGIGYRFLTDVGRTPFQFDRRDLRHELRLQYQVGGPWAFGFVSRFDLERSRIYDSDVAVVRNFDCIQVGFAFNPRSRQFNIILNVLPPLRNVERRRFPLGTQSP